MKFKSYSIILQSITQNLALAVFRILYYASKTILSPRFFIFKSRVFPKRQSSVFVVKFTKIEDKKYKILTMFYNNRTIKSGRALILLC